MRSTNQWQASGEKEKNSSLLSDTSRNLNVESGKRGEREKEMREGGEEGGREEKRKVFKERNRVVEARRGDTEKKSEKERDK